MKIFIILDTWENILFEDYLKIKVLEKEVVKSFGLKTKLMINDFRYKRE